MLPLLLLLLHETVLWMRCFLQQPVPLLWLSITLQLLLFPILLHSCCIQYCCCG
jgi:hypothetical protein